MSFRQKTENILKASNHPNWPFGHGHWPLLYVAIYWTLKPRTIHGTLSNYLQSMATYLHGPLTLKTSSITPTDRQGFRSHALLGTEHPKKQVPLDALEPGALSFLMTWDGSAFPPSMPGKAEESQEVNIPRCSNYMQKFCLVAGFYKRKSQKNICIIGKSIGLFRYVYQALPDQACLPKRHSIDVDVLSQIHLQRSGSGELTRQSKRFALGTRLQSWLMSDSTHKNPDWFDSYLMHLCTHG